MNWNYQIYSYSKRNKNGTKYLFSFLIPLDTTLTELDYYYKILYQIRWFFF